MKMKINIEECKKVKKILILSNIYDFIISIFKIKNIYITIFLVILGIVSVLFFQKIIEFQSYSQEIRESKSKKYKIGAVILDAIIIFTFIFLGAYYDNLLIRRLSIPIYSFGLFIKVACLIIIMDNTVDELKIKWK